MLAQWGEVYIIPPRGGKRRTEEEEEGTNGIRTRDEPSDVRLVVVVVVYNVAWGCWWGPQKQQGVHQEDEEEGGPQDEDEDPHFLKTVFRTPKTSVYKFKDEERREKKGPQRRRRGRFALHRLFQISLLKSFQECEKRFVFFSYSKREEWTDGRTADRTAQRVGWRMHSWIISYSESKLFKKRKTKKKEELKKTTDHHHHCT